MRVLAWSLCCAMAFATACGGAIAPASGDGGSGSSSGSISASSSSGGASGDDGSITGHVTGSSSSSTSSSGGVIDAMTTGCGNGAPPPMEQAPACDQCITTNCEDSWCACAGDSSADDAGNLTGCLGYVDCILACINGAPDAGVPDASIQQCAMNCAPAYSQQVVNEGDSLLGCLAGNCASATTCGQ